MAKGIFANIGNLFKTTEELEHEKRQRWRRLERRIEKAVDILKDVQRKAEKSKEKLYQEAKRKLAVGNKTEARLYLQQSRRQACRAGNYMRQQLMWSDALDQLRVAKTIQEAAQCFSKLAAEYGLDPDIFEDGVDSMSDVESILDEMNKAMTKKWEKDSLKAGEEGDVEDDAAIDEMMAQAEREVAAENGASATEAGSAAPAHA